MTIKVTDDSVATFGATDGSGAVGTVVWSVWENTVVNVLPWLLDWPPSRASIVVFLVLTAFSAGTLVLFGGVTDEVTDDRVTIEETDLAVRLNDDGGIPEWETGTVQKCLASGTPGDTISVLGDVTIDVPAERDRGFAEEPRFRIDVSLAHTDETTTATVRGTGRETGDVFWLLEDDETLSVGDTASLQIRVREDGSTVANATRPVTVGNGSRSYDC